MIVKMAFLYVQGSEWYKAIEEYKKLVQMDPTDPHVYNMMGDAYVKKNDEGEAFEVYLKSRELYGKLGNAMKVAAIEKKIAKLSPDKMDLKKRQLFQSISKTQEAERLVAEGNVDDAVAYYLQLIAAEPINFSYREKLCALFLEHARVTEAVAQMKAVADHHLSEGRPEMAATYAGKMAEMDPEGLDTIRLLAVLAKQKGDTEGITKYYGKLAQLAFDAGQYEEAKSAAELASQAGSSLKLLLARTLLALKQTQEAKKQFEILLRENPEDDSLLEQMVSLSEETRDWATAYVHLGELMKRREGDAKLLPRMARILLQTGKRMEALQIYANLAGEALKENKVEAAFTYFDSILALDPENVDILKKKAEVYLKLGKKQEVIDTYKKLLAIFTQKKMVEEAKKVSLVLTKLSALK
jgi:predicted Zn-dependent protease